MTQPILQTIPAILIAVEAHPIAAGCVWLAYLVTPMLRQLPTLLKPRRLR